MMCDGKQHQASFEFPAYERASGTAGRKDPLPFCLLALEIAKRIKAKTKFVSLFSWLRVIPANQTSQTALSTPDLYSSADAQHCSALWVLLPVKSWLFGEPDSRLLSTRAKSISRYKHGRV